MEARSLAEVAAEQGGDAREGGRVAMHGGYREGEAEHAAEALPLLALLGESKQCCTFTGMIPVFGLFLILLEWYGMGGIYGMRAKFDSFD